MLTRFSAAVLLTLLCSAWGCSSPNPNVQVRRLSDGRLEVKGPLAGPFKTSEELARYACELMTSQPRATFGQQGMEYCALGYLAQDDRSYYLSYLSDMGGDLPGGRKFCTVPAALDDPSRRAVLILIRIHTHPNNRRFSDEDLSIERGWDATRLSDKTTGQVMERYLWVLYRERTGACSIHQYNYSSRVISALREGRWLPIGKVVNATGKVELFEGRDWVP